MSNLQTIMQKNIIQVRLISRSCPQRMGINEKYLGLDSENEEVKDFMKKQLESSLRFFPKDQLSRIQRVTKRLNQSIKRASLAKGVNGYFVDISKYSKIKKDYLKTQEEFDDVKQIILDNYDSSISSFEKNAKDFLTERSADLSLLDNIMDKFPKKGVIEESFICSLEVQPYPVLDNSLNCKDSSLVTDIVKKHEEDSINVYHNMVTTLFAQGCELICSILDKIEDGEDLPSRTKSKIGTYMKALKKSNSWLKNSDLTNLESYLDRVLVSCKSLFKNEYGEFESLDSFAHLEELEFILSFIFNSCEKMNTESALPLDDLYDEASLKLMYSLNPLDKTAII